MQMFLSPINFWIRARCNPFHSQIIESIFVAVHAKRGQLSAFELFIIPKSHVTDLDAEANLNSKPDT